MAHAPQDHAPNLELKTTRRFQALPGSRIQESVLGLSGEAE